VDPHLASNASRQYQFIIVCVSSVMLDPAHLRISVTLVNWLTSNLWSAQKIGENKAASNVGPYGLFWQPALVRYSSILYLCLLIGQIKMLACLLKQ